MADTSESGELVLVVEDDPSIKEIITFSLETDGYRYVVASDGEEALRQVEQEPPDLILLDLMIPKVDGIEVCRRLKNGFLTSGIPIVMVTAKREVSDKLKGMEAGADDYIIKPFNRAELLARVKMVMMRTRQQIDRNPLSGLPGNYAIENRARELLDGTDEFVILYMDLDNFKNFNDSYGYSTGDKAIKLASTMLVEIVKDYGSESDFVGHIGGDDFVIICQPPNAKPICKEIIRRYEKESERLFDPDSLNKGYYVTKGRKGEESKLPCRLGMTIAVVVNDNNRYANYLEMVDVAAELKKHGKTIEGSVYLTNRRSSTE
ncbi:MAG: response regulator [bacterium]|nr:response regulator [bacterium]